MQGRHGPPLKHFGQSRWALPWQWGVAVAALLLLAEHGSFVAASPLAKHSSVEAAPRALQHRSTVSPSLRSDKLHCETNPSIGPSANISDLQQALPPWVPTPKKYLLAFCHQGQWTNHLHCMQRSLVLAALLNRTLVLPMIDVCAATQNGNKAPLLVDIHHLRRCLSQGILESAKHSGPHVKPAIEHEVGGLGVKAGPGVITLSEYLHLHRTDKLRVDMLMCEGTSGYPHHCPPKKCSAVNRILFPFRRITAPVVPLYTEQLTDERLHTLRRATEHVGVLSVGDTFFVHVAKHRFLETLALSPLFRSPCGLMFQQGAPIFKLASKFSARKLSGPYAALHFRRGDFSRFCSKRGCSYWSIPQIAKCVGDEMAKLGLKKLFVASNAGPREMGELKSLMSPRGIKVIEYMLRKKTFEKALTDQTLCAQSRIFFHQELSTFSYRIRQLRDGLGTASCEDQTICQGRDRRFDPGKVR